MTMSSNNNPAGQFGDTTLTKVFVGGLAWETQKECMRDHFEKFGEILEAVIISDKNTGRSKGYGFVTFKEAESAKKAREDATPIINGRRANCNLASLGALRPRSMSATAAPPPPQQGSNVGPRSASPAPPNHVQWYYPTPGSTPASFYHHHHHHHQPIPFYGYSPYVATDVNYNHKVSYSGGSYMNGGHFPPQPQVYSSSSSAMPMYPLYHFQTMGPHIYPQSTALSLPNQHQWLLSTQVRLGLVKNFKTKKID